MQNQSELDSGLNRRTVIRKRRTRRHRRNIIFRRLLIGLMLMAVASAGSVIVLRHLSPSLFRAAGSVDPDRQAAEASRNTFLHTQQDALRSMEGRPVYPYSVVRGGVKDVGELKWAAEHDPIVAAHYAGFDYDHGRVVRLVLARTAYVSYRIGNKIYWTHRRVTLKKGETVITDGRITARTRCANRVEEIPQVAYSASEPPALKFDEPLPTLGTATSNPPVPYQSSLLNRAAVPGLGPAPPLSLYEPFGSGTYVPVFPPPPPIGVCGPVKKKPGHGGIGSAMTAGGGKKKKPVDPCSSGGGGGGEVPEPSTWILFTAGIAGTYWMTRLRVRIVSPTKQ